MEATRFDPTLRVLLGRRRARQSSKLDSTLSFSHPVNPATMTTIDHLSFPHIIDHVWSYLSVSDLKHIRAVSKSWLVRSDLSLSNHIVIERRGDSGFEVRARCLRHQDATQVITKEFENGCSCSFKGSRTATRDDEDEGETCRFCHRLLGCPTIDVGGYTPNALDVETPPFSALPGTATIRWLRSLGDQPTVHWRLAMGSDQVFFLQHDGTSGFDLTVEAIPDEFPETVELVFNFSCTANPTTQTSPTQIHIPHWQELETRAALPSFSTTRGRRGRRLLHSTQPFSWDSCSAILQWASTSLLSDSRALSRRQLP